MRAVLQRVTDADVSVDSKITGKIGKGFVILLGVEDGDSEADADYLVEKISSHQAAEIGALSVDFSKRDPDTAFKHAALSLFPAR